MKNQLEKALADLRHAYHQLTEGVVKDQSKFAEGLIAPAICRIEQALKPGDPVYQIWRSSDSCGEFYSWEDVDADEFVTSKAHESAKRTLYTAPQLNLNCKSVQKRLAEQWGFAPQTQPKQEEVAWISKTGHGTYFRETITPELAELEFGGRKMWTPLYAAPQPQQWVGLTDEELHEHCLHDEDYRFARVIEAKLREKNGASK